MKCIILAAGTGSRMLSMTKDKPKAAVKFLNKSLISYQLEVLEQSGINDIQVVTGHCADYFTDINLSTVYNPFYRYVNMVASLYCSLCDSIKHEDILICYSDIIYSHEVIRNLVNNGKDSLISISSDPEWLALWRLRMNDVIDDAETFNYDHNLNLTDIGQKINDLSEVRGQYRGIVFVKSEYIVSLLKIIENEFFAKGKLNAYMTDLLQFIMQSGEKIKVDLTPGDWLEFDNQTDLAVYERAQATNVLNSHMGWLNSPTFTA